jgi:anionic cell wall polymer biosynthesis LytR-Cps2A-Psr (LCP) family protein
VTEHDATDIYLDEDQEDGQVEFEHWRDAARRRAEAEIRRAARQRRRALIVIGAVVFALLVGLIGWKVVVASRAKAPEEVALGGKRASVMFQLRAPDGGAAASVLIMHDRSADSGGMLAIPRDLMLDVPGEGVIPLSDALIIAGESLTRDALADLLGATIHGSFTFDPATFAAVIDRLGGVEMAIDHPIVIKGKTVAEPAGDQPVRLRGEAALQYATDEVPGETTAQSAERFATVVQAFLQRIPDQFESAASLFAALGVVGNGTMPPDQLAAILAGAAGDLRSKALTSDILPISANGSGFIDPVAAGSIVRTVLGSAVQTLRADGTPRVMVQLGVSQPEAQEAMKAEILNSGYRYIDGGELPDALSDPRATTTITAFGEHGDDAGRALAIALGFDPKIVKMGQGLGIADVLVVIGGDYDYQPVASPT